MFFWKSVYFDVYVIFKSQLKHFLNWWSICGYFRDIGFFFREVNASWLFARTQPWICQHDAELIGAVSSQRRIAWTGSTLIDGISAFDGAQCQPDKEVSRITDRFGHTMRWQFDWDSRKFYSCQIFCCLFLSLPQFTFSFFANLWNYFLSVIEFLLSSDSCCNSIFLNTKRSLVHTVCIFFYSLGSMPQQSTLASWANVIDLCAVA